MITIIVLLVKNWDKVKEVAVNAGNTIKNKIGEAVENIKNKLSGFKDKVVEIFNGVVDKIKDIGKNIAEGLWNGINDKVSWIKDKLKGFKDSVMNALKSFFGIHSPSTLMRDQIGKFIPQGIAVGIEANTKSIDKAVDKMNSEMLNKMQSAVNMETGRISANATVRSNANYNSVVYVNASFDGSVEMDNTKVGRIIAPSVAKTLKVQGA